MTLQSTNHRRQITGKSFTCNLNRGCKMQYQWARYKLLLECFVREMIRFIFHCNTQYCWHKHTAAKMSGSIHSAFGVLHVPLSRCSQSIVVACSLPPIRLPHVAISTPPMPCSALCTLHTLLQATLETTCLNIAHQ